MNHVHLAAPVVTLVAWSQVIQVWMFATRFRALRLAGITLKGRQGGPTRTGLEGVVPDPVSWKAHNYAHLMEQPTIFYAVMFALMFLNHAAPLTILLAWGYVGLRIVHSLIQTTRNVVTYRLAAFGLGSLCLALLTIEAAVAIAVGQ